MAFRQMSLYTESMKKIVVKQKNYPFLLAISITAVFACVYLFGKNYLLSNLNVSINDQAPPSPSINEDLSTVTKIVSPGKALGLTATWTPFELDIPSGWKLTRRTNELLAVLVKDDYEMSIGYPIEGLVCNFPDTEPFEGPAEDLELQSEFRTTFGVVRIGKTPERPEFSDQFFRVCQQEENSSYWTAGLRIGYIYYKTPLNLDPKIIEEMNAIVKSIKIIN